MLNASELTANPNPLKYTFTQSFLYFTLLSVQIYVFYKIQKCITQRIPPVITVTDILIFRDVRLFFIPLETAYSFPQTHTAPVYL